MAALAPNLVVLIIARALQGAAGAILSVSLVSLLLAISKGREWGWGEPLTVGLLVLGAVAIVGGSVGTAVIAAVVASNTGPRGIPADAAFTEGFRVCAAVAVVAIVAALALPSARRRRLEAAAALTVDTPPSR